MQAHSPVDGLTVYLSSMWRTSCTVYRSGAETLVVDSPVLPAELDALAAAVGNEAGSGVLLTSTHGDWDHVLGRLAFPAAPLHVERRTAERLRVEGDRVVEQLTQFDEEHYLERGAPLDLSAEAVDAPGAFDLGGVGVESELTAGHTADGMALWIEAISTFVVGDYLSPIELPIFSETGSRSAYQATLARLRPRVEAADRVVSGHGGSISSAAALAILAEDEHYLASGEPPAGRAGLDANQRTHAANLERWDS